MFGQHSNDKENQPPPGAKSTDHEQSLLAIHQQIQLHLQGTIKLSKFDVRELAKKLDSFTCTSLSQETIVMTAHDILFKIFEDLAKEEKSAHLSSSTLKSPSKKRLASNRSSLSPYTVPSQLLQNSDIQVSLRQESETLTASEGNLNLTTQITQNRIFTSSEQSGILIKNPFMNRPGSSQNPDFISFLPNNEQLDSKTNHITQNQRTLWVPYHLGQTDSSENSSLIRNYLAISDYEEMSQRNYTALPLENNILKLQFNRVSDGQDISFPRELLTNDNFRTQLSGAEDNSGQQLLENSPLSTGTTLNTPGYSLSNQNATQISGDTFEQPTEPNSSTNDSVQIPTLTGSSTLLTVPKFNTNKGKHIDENFRIASTGATTKTSSYSVRNQSATQSSGDTFEQPSEKTPSRNYSVQISTLSGSSTLLTVPERNINKGKHVDEAESEMLTKSLSKEDYLIISAERDEQSFDRSLVAGLGDSLWNETTLNENEAAQCGADAAESIDSDLTQIVKEMIIDEDLTQVDDENNSQSQNPTHCAQMIAPNQNSSSLLCKFKRQESNFSVVENTPQENYRSYTNLPILKNIPSPDHDYLSQMVIDETQSLATNKAGTMEQINELCKDLNIVKCNKNTTAAQSCTKNSKPVWSRNQSFSLLDMQSMKRIPTLVSTEDEVIEATINEESAASERNTETANLMLIDGDLVQTNQIEEASNAFSFAKQQELKADEIMKIRAKYSDKWNDMPLSEKISQKFVDKFKIRILEEDVQSLLDINYRPNFNSFYFPRLSEEETLLKLQESSDLADQISAALDSASQEEDEDDMETMDVDKQNKNSKGNVEAEDDNGGAKARSPMLDTCSSSSEDTPNRKWVKDYLTKAKLEMATMWENSQGEKSPIERFRWNEDHEEEEEPSEPALTKEELFDRMCRQLGTADWLNVNPDDL